MQTSGVSISSNGINPRHIPVIAAAATAAAQRSVRLRHVAVIAAATAAATLSARIPRGRRIVRYRRGASLPWLTQGRVRNMNPHPRHQL